MLVIMIFAIFPPCSLLCTPLLGGYTTLWGTPFLSCHFSAQESAVAPYCLAILSQHHVPHATLLFLPLSFM